jgi:hypothetical protein
MTELQHEATANVISYDDIPRHCDSARTDRPYTFLLSHRQAQLYRAKLRHDLLPPGERSPTGVIAYTWVVARILLTCRYLFLLGQFHEFYPNDLRAITFEETIDGVLMKTNPPRPRSVSQ